MLVHTVMNHLRNFAALVALLPLAAGCAARTAPFDQLDKAQVTVLRLQQPQAQAGQSPIPQIPGMPAELQQMGQAVLQGAQSVVPGLQNMLPGLIPGAQPQAQQAAPQFKGYSIVAQMPLGDEKLKEELLDIFGSESSFSNQVQNCFAPGMGFVFQQPNAPQVDLLISLSCNQAKMDGGRWPYAVNGFTPETRSALSKIYEKLFGPVPPNA
jgi:hypothetical protein